MIKLTITLPVYQSENTIRNAMNSIMNQTDKNFKLIVVHDGSTDKTYDILKEYKEKFDFTLIHNEKKLGQDAAFNLSHDLVDTEYIGFFMGDDELYPNYVEEVNKFIDATGADFIRTFWMKGNIPRNPELDNDASPGRIYTKKLWQEIGGYHPIWDYYNDNDFWEKIKHHDPPYKIGTIRKPLYRYYRKPGSISSNIQLKKSKGEKDKNEFMDTWRVWESKYVGVKDNQNVLEWNNKLLSLLNISDVGIYWKETNTSDKMNGVVYKTIEDIKPHDVMILDGFYYSKLKSEDKIRLLDRILSNTNKHFISTFMILATEMNYRERSNYEILKEGCNTDINVVFQKLNEYGFEYTVETNLRYLPYSEIFTNEDGYRLFRVYARKK